MLLLCACAFFAIVRSAMLYCRVPVRAPEFVSLGGTEPRANLATQIVAVYSGCDNPDVYELKRALAELQSVVDEEIGYLDPEREESAR